jgi:hypothetical protein
MVSSLWLLFVNRVKDLSSACTLFEGKILEGAANSASWFAHAISRMSTYWDRWVLDGSVNFTGKFIRFWSHPVRLLQSGVISTYAAFALLGLVLMLAYYGRHMLYLVRNLR